MAPLPISRLAMARVTVLMVVMMLPAMGRGENYTVSTRRTPYLGVAVPHRDANSRLQGVHDGGACVCMHGCARRPIILQACLRPHPRLALRTCARSLL